jgi:heme oxygenase (mycobilin-producing)
MSVVKINAITVPEGKGPELEERFAKRAREVETMPGFESFELLRPVEGETRYFVYTRWESEAAFQRWVNSLPTSILRSAMN